MNTLSILLQAAGQATPQGGGLQMIIMMAAIFVIFYFFMIRPQRKKQKEINNFQNTLAPGSEVITQGGIYGTVKKVDEMTNTLYIEVAKDVQIRVTRNAVYPSANDAVQK